MSVRPFRMYGEQKRVDDAKKDISSRLRDESGSGGFLGDDINFVERIIQCLYKGMGKHYRRCHLDELDDLEAVLQDRRFSNTLYRLIGIAEKRGELNGEERPIDVYRPLLGCDDRLNQVVLGTLLRDIELAEGYAKTRAKEAMNKRDICGFECNILDYYGSILSKKFAVIKLLSIEYTAAMADDAKLIHYPSEREGFDALKQQISQISRKVRSAQKAFWKKCAGIDKNIIT